MLRERKAWPGASSDVILRFDSSLLLVVIIIMLYYYSRLTVRDSPLDSSGHVLFRVRTSRDVQKPESILIWWRGT